MRLGETYLIAAEAAGRKGDYNLAADLINIIRERASWKAGEKKVPLPQQSNKSRQDAYVPIHVHLFVHLLFLLMDPRYFSKWDNICYFYLDHSYSIENIYTYMFYFWEHLSYNRLQYL